MTLTFWRPQRRPIPPGAGEWVDIGRLYYQAQPSDADVGQCPQSTLSESDPNLAVGPPDENFSPPAGGFNDMAADQPANPASTFTYTLNLTQCLALRGLSFNPGETRTIFLVANTLGGGAAQTVSFKRQ